MRLPGIPTGGPVQDPSRTAALPGQTAAQAVSGTGRLVAEAIGALSGELAKTQRIRADAKFQGGLEQAQESLNRPYVKVSEVKAALGDGGIEKLPQEQRAFVEWRKDDDLVPTWAVGEAMFSAQAQKAQEEAAKEIGWHPSGARDFGAGAAREISSRRFQLGARYIQEQHDYQVASRTASYLHRVDNARTPEEWAQLGTDLDTDGVLSEPQRQALAQKAGVAHDTTPIYDALRTNDPADLQAQLAALNDPQQRTHLTPRERAAFAAQLEHELTSVQRTRRDAGLAQQAVAAVDELAGAYRSGRWLDGNAIMGAIDSLEGAEPELKEKMRAAAHTRITLDGEARTRAAQGEMNKALLVLRNNHDNLADPDLAPMREWFLDDTNGHAKAWTDLEDRIGRERQMRGREWRADAAAARREQEAKNRQAIEEYQLEANRDRAAAAGLDVETLYSGADKSTRTHIAGLQAKDATLVRGGGAASLTESHDLALKEAEGLGLLENEKEKAAFEGWWRDWYSGFLVTSKGRPPTRAELRQEVGKQLQLVETDSEAWFFKGEKRRFELQLGESARPRPPERQDSDLAKTYTATHPEERGTPPPPGVREGLDVLGQAMAEEEKTKVSRRAAIADIRRRHPDWKPDQVTAELRKRGL